MDGYSISRQPFVGPVERRVQVGLSLMPEEIRRWLAPHGSPTDELLDSLAWAVSQGGLSPVVRMAVIWQRRSLYPDRLTACRDRLGRSGWRLTPDILRFTPATASIIAGRHPEGAAVFAREIAPQEERDLRRVAREAKGGDEHVKKIRPPEARQREIYTWLRKRLNEMGCRGVDLVACKGDPDQLAPLARNKTIRAMPCACYPETDSCRRGCGQEVQVDRMVALNVTVNRGACRGTKN